MRLFYFVGMISVDNTILAVIIFMKVRCIFIGRLEFIVVTCMRAALIRQTVFLRFLQNSSSIRSDIRQHSMRNARHKPISKARPPFTASSHENISCCSGDEADKTEE